LKTKVPENSDLPHPAAKNDIKVSLIKILTDTVINGSRRMLVEFISGTSMPVEPTRAMFDANAVLALFITQKGRKPALWLEDQFWRVAKKRWTNDASFTQRVHEFRHAKLHLQNVNIDDGHKQMLYKAISKHL
jgi:hypothetical protein